MAEGEKQGAVAAVAALGAGDPPGAAGGEAQPELFDAEDAPTPLGEASAVGRSGPKGGRPRGARNRRTAEWCDFILSQYRSPLVVMAETYSMPVEELAAKLGCDKLDAFKAQQAAAVALAPYLHQRQPMALEIEQRSRGLLLIGEMGGDGTADGFAIPFANVEEYQQLSDEQAEKSDGAESRTDAKPLVHKDNSANDQ